MTKEKKSISAEVEEKPEKTEKAKTKPKKARKKLKLSPLALIIIGILVLLAIIKITFGVMVYGYHNESAAIKTASRVLLFPSEVIEGKYVTVYSYLNQLDILKKYYVEFKKVDFASEDGKKKLTEIRTDVLDRIAEDAIVEKEAAKQKIKIESKTLNEEYDKLIASNGGQKNFSEILNKYYGLTIDDYKKVFFAPKLLRQKLTDKINSEEDETGAAKKKSEEILAKAKAGEDFAKLAMEFSGDPGSAAKGGDVGYFGKGKMVPEFEKAAFEAKVGDIVGPIKTVYGYHIIKVTDKKGDEVKASHVLIKTRDFNEWLSEKKTELKKQKYLGFIPAYWVLIKAE